MKRVLVAILVAICLLSGCSVLDGSYVSVKPHEANPDGTEAETVSVKEYSQLYDAIKGLVYDGGVSLVLAAKGYPSNQLTSDTNRAISQLCLQDPVAAYAVENITFEEGKNRGQPAIALSVSYVHDRMQIRKIKNVDTIEQGMKIVTAALDQCRGSAVFRVRNYDSTDFELAVANYAMANPHLVMEQPRVSVNLYPQAGKDRVVELVFLYQTPRDALYTMQEKVRPVFTSAALYVSGDAQPMQKYDQLASFLMERFDYQHNTSITPAYSLLCHGVGDSRAIAMVYAAMCRQAGLDCQTVSGTCQGESRFWNIIRVGDTYYHADLFTESFVPCGDTEMVGYVWDYSAYPVCGEEK